MQISFRELRSYFDLFLLTIVFVLTYLYFFVEF